jgi:homoserine O-succinyltransferase/O-acetyltransferase
MSILVDGGRVPDVLSSKNGSPHAERIRIALINNMPDAALEDTEVQFFDLLDSAAGGDIPVSLKLFSLPEIPRGAVGRERLNNFYFSVSDLLNSHFDGVIMTGTEPMQADLRDEPYWPVLTEVLDWAEQNTASTILSCLAAHAGVLYSDGIPRHRLRDKQFGVFEYEKVREHALTAGFAETMQIPHSRWNEVRAEALASCGYEILTQSAQAGVDSFVKIKRGSLFVHFQGHPEYGTRTLLKEYRRDIKRFLRRERETYPTMPHGYFGSAATKLLSDFREHAVAEPQEETLASFPETAVIDAIGAGWHAAAASVYRNWLQYLVSTKACIPALSAMAAHSRKQNRKVRAYGG